MQVHKRTTCPEFDEDFVFDVSSDELRVGFRCPLLIHVEYTPLGVAGRAVRRILLPPVDSC